MGIDDFGLIYVISYREMYYANISESEPMLRQPIFPKRDSNRLETWEAFTDCVVCAMENQGYFA